MRDNKIDDLQNQINALKNQSGTGTGTGTDTGAGNVGIFWVNESFGYLKSITYNEYSNSYESGADLCFYNTIGGSKCIRKYSYDYSGDG